MTTSDAAARPRRRLDFLARHSLLLPPGISAASAPGHEENAAAEIYTIERLDYRL